MTINLANNNPRIAYSLAQAATQQTFVIPFEFFNNSDVTVYIDGVLKSEGTHYSLTGGDGSTGNVVFNTTVTGATGGSTIVIFRLSDIERTSDFSAGADINRAALNEQLDILTAMIADQDDRIDRTIQVNDYEVAPSLILPTIANRKGKVLAFNATTGAVEAGPSVSAVDTVANTAADIQTVADNIAVIQASPTNATNAAASASAASSSASAASSSASSASSSAASAAASFDNFDDRYLGAKTSDPTLDNDGNALLTGALYFDSIGAAMKVYTGSAWVTAFVSLSGALIASNNLSDLTNTTSARTNLGLGSIATQAASSVAITGGTIAGGTITGGSINNTPIGATTASTIAGTTLDVVGQASFGDGTAAAPSITNTGDTNTGIFFPAADTVAVTTGGSERLRVDSSGNFYVGTTSQSGGSNITLSQPANADMKIAASVSTATRAAYQVFVSTTVTTVGTENSTGGSLASGTAAYSTVLANSGAYPLSFATNNTERARVTSDGDFLFGKTISNTSSVGCEIQLSGVVASTRSANLSAIFGRNTDDGQIVQFRQDGATEGSISVSGTTVSYNGGHLSRWAQFPDNSRPNLLKGTVMSNLDQMSNWSGEDNEQLNCVQVSAVEGDVDVAGVFVAWDSEDDGYNDILLGMTGDMVIRIAAGTLVQRGDLLMSAGDGTAKPQGDDVVRSKTIAKVISTHVSHTYADGSYAVPCVLMAC